MRRKPLQSATEVFDALGGHKRVAELTGSDINAVYNWKSFGRFPWHTQHKLVRALAELDPPHSASEDLWGMRK